MYRMIIPIVLLLMCTAAAWGQVNPTDPTSFYHPNPRPTIFPGCDGETTWIYGSVPMGSNTSSYVWPKWCPGSVRKTEFAVITAVGKKVDLAFSSTFISFDKEPSRNRTDNIFFADFHQGRLGLGLGVPLSEVAGDVMFGPRYKVNERTTLYARFTEGLKPMFGLGYQAGKYRLQLARDMECATYLRVGKDNWQLRLAQKDHGDLQIGGAVCFTWK